MATNVGPSYFREYTQTLLTWTSPGVSESYIAFNSSLSLFIDPYFTGDSLIADVATNEAALASQVQGGQAQVRAQRGQADHCG